ncbi:MAG: hypothetical protein RIQ81_1135 [Pseudomonadota bacterium]
MRLLTIMAFSVFAVTACGDQAAFNSRGKKAAARADAVGLSATCNSPAIMIDQATLSKSNGMATISGELCPTVSSDVHIQMVVDFSGSMGTNDPAIGSMANITCGRYKAIRTIADKLKASAAKEDKITLSIIGFGSAATDVLAETDISQFNPQPSTICRRDGGNTNYKAALERASARLASSSRKAKVTYFISDGFPTEGGNVPGIQPFNPFDPNSINNIMNQAGNLDAHAIAGEEAANALRAANPSVTVNALLLNPSTGDYPVDPAGYLARITGDTARVRIVNQANDLAERAAELLALPVTLDTSKVSARIAADGAQPSQVVVKSMSQSPSSAAKWIFTTAPIDLGKIMTASKGKPAAMTLEAQESGGRKHSVTITIGSP